MKGMSLLSLKQGGRRQLLQTPRERWCDYSYYKAGRLEREMRKLDATFNPAAREMMGTVTVIEANKEKNKEAK
jgi:hypothetical protein